MHIVAIHNLQIDALTATQSLAKILAKTPYEVRPRINAASQGPAVVGSFPEESTAQHFESELKSLGFDVLTLNTQDPIFDQLAFQVRLFQLGQSSLKIQSRQGKEVLVPYASVQLLLRGTNTQQESHDKQVKGRKFSMGRAVMTGGLIRSKKTETTQTTRTTHKESFLHLYCEGSIPIAFRENEVLYDSLGEAMQPSRMANFNIVNQHLKTTCSHALFDERLMRNNGFHQILGPALPSEENVEVAIRLLCMTLLP